LIAKKVIFSKYNFNLDQKDLDTICLYANRNFQHTQHRNEQYYEYKVGDFVAIRNIDTPPEVNKKFAHKYRGLTWPKSSLPN